MVLWLMLSLMTTLAAVVVVWPLARGAKGLKSGSEVMVYRDQLEEIDRNRAIGAIGAVEAEAARVEISRRLLAADAAAASAATSARAHTPAASWRRRAAAIGAVIMLSLGSVSLYLALGSPNLTSTSLAAPPNDLPEHQSVVALLQQAEAHLASHPDDGRGWAVVAPVYMQISRYNDAVRARANVLRLLGETAERQADLGEALVAAANGVVTAEAKAAFERALALDAKDVAARFYVGLAAEQDNRREDARKIWNELLAEAPPGATWAEFVRRALARVEGAPSVSPPGPTAADVEAAAKAPPEQQTDMIQGMVQRLADRLKQDGSDADGWIRLVRSYVVLGDKQKAQAAVLDARRALASDPDKVRRVDETAKGLGLEG